jgi:hypothetical protein
MSGDRTQRSLLRIGLLFLLFIAPFDQGPGRDLVPLTCAAVTTVLLATAFLRRRLTAPAGTQQLRSPALLPALAFLAVAALSLLWSIDRFVTLTGLVRLGSCTLVFLLILAEFRSAQDARRLCLALVVLAVLLCPLGVWQAFARAGLHPTNGGARAHATFVTPNTFAGFLIVTLPLGLALALTARRSLAAAALWPAIGLMALALLLTQSRGGWAAGAAGLLLFAGLLAQTRPGRPRRGSVILGLLAIAALAGAGTALVLARPELRRRMLSLGRPHRSATLHARLLYWDAAARMAAEAWPAGFGLDTYHLAYPAHQDRRLAGTTQWFAHHDYLQTLVELGPVGLGALLWFLWRVGRAADGGLRAGADRRQTVLVAGCAASAAGGLLHCLVDYNLYVPATVLSMYACFGILAAAHARRMPQFEAVRPPSAAGRTVRRALAALVLVPATVAVLAVCTPLLGQRLLAASRFNAPLAVMACPLPAEYRARLGHVQARPYPAKAARAYREAIALSPHTPAYYIYLGRLLLQNGKLPADFADNRTGLACLCRACALAPNDAVPRWWLARAYLDLGRPRAARRELRACIERCSSRQERLRVLAERLLTELETPAQDRTERSDEPTDRPLVHAAGTGRGDEHPRHPGCDGRPEVRGQQAAAPSSGLARTRTAHQHGP